MPLGDPVGLSHGMSVLGCNLGLCMVCSKLLPPCFLLGLLFGLTLLECAPAISLLLLLLSLGHLLFQLCVMITLGLLLELHTNGLQSLEARKSWLEWRYACCVVHHGSLGASIRTRSRRLQTLVHNKHKPLFFCCKSLVGCKFGNCSLATFGRGRWVVVKWACQKLQQILRCCKTIHWI